MIKKFKLFGVSKQCGINICNLEKCNKLNISCRLCSKFDIYFCPKHIGFLKIEKKSLICNDCYVFKDNYESDSKKNPEININVQTFDRQKICFCNECLKNINREKCNICGAYEYIQICSECERKICYNCHPNEMTTINNDINCYQSISVKGLGFYNDDEIITEFFMIS